MLPHIQQLTSLLASQAAEKGGEGFGGSQLMLPVIMMLILYFVWIRPAGKERKSHQTMLDALKRGDEVVTSSGILGTVADIQEKVMTLEVARNVKIRVLKSSVSKRVADLADADDKSEKKSDKKSDDKSTSKKS